MEDKDTRAENQKQQSGSASLEVPKSYRKPFQCPPRKRPGCAVKIFAVILVLCIPVSIAAAFLPVTDGTPQSYRIIFAVSMALFSAAFLLLLLCAAVMNQFQTIREEGTILPADMLKQYRAVCMMHYVEAVVLRSCTLESPDILRDIAKIRNLHRIQIQDCDLADITPLFEKTKSDGIFAADLSDNQIRDITALSQQRRLQKLTLRNNRITDLSPLTGLRELKELDISGNPVQDLGPLSSIRLNSLHIEGCPLTDLSPLCKIPTLFNLYISSEQEAYLGSLTKSRYLTVTVQKELVDL